MHLNFDKTKSCIPFRNGLHLLMLLAFLSFSIDSRAAISFRDFAQNGVASGTLTVNVPAATQQDDVMIAFITWRSSTPTVTAPAGWTLIRETTQAAGGATSNRLASYYRVATNSEPASYSWSFSAAITGASGGIVSFNGVDTSNPVDADGGNTTPNGFNHTANSITTTVANTMVVSAHEFPSATSNWTPPTGMTEAVDVASIARPAAPGIALSVNYVSQAAIGATGNKTAAAAAPGTDAGAGAAQLLALTPDLSPTPIAEWQMEETSWNGTAGEGADSRGNNLHGTAINGTTNTVTNPAIAGSPGTCRYGDFDGVNDLIEVADDPLLDIPSELTVTVWMNTRTIPGSGLKSIISKDENFEFHVNAAGRINWWWGGGVQELTSSGTIAINTWYHIAIVYSASGSFQRIYIDGVQDPNTNNQSANLTLNNDPFHIGGDQGFGGREFDGLIDEVRVYDQALTTAQIQTVMNETRACAPPPPGNNIYLSTTGGATIGGNTFEDGDLFEYDTGTDTSTAPPFFDESANPPGVPNMDIDAAHLIDSNTLIFSPAQDETIDGFAYQDGDLIRYDIATDTFSEFFSEDFYVGGADTDALYLISDSATQSVFLISTTATETIGGNSFTDGDVFQVIYDHPNGIGGPGESITTSIVLDESIFGTGVDVDAVHLLDSGNYILSMVDNETIGGFTYEDGDLIEYDPVGGTFSEFFSEDRYSGNEDTNAVTMLPVVAGIDHYDIDISPAAGITCLPVTVTITAKDASNNTVAHTMATTINLATSTGTGTWGAASVGTTTNIVAGAGTADYEFANGQSTVDIQFNYPVLTGAAPESVNINITSTPNETTGVAVMAEDDPSIDFNTAALIFNNVTDGNNIIPTQISGKDSSAAPNAVTLNIQAVRASDNDPSVCQSIFGNGDVVSVDLGAECRNPAQCEGLQLEITNSAPATSGGVNIATSNDDSVAQTVAAYTSVDLEFGANSAATIVLNYPDAGLMQLHARYELLLDDGTASGEFAVGISNDFVVKPAGLCVESTDSDSDCASGDHTCSVFRKAGSIDAENFFNLTVRGVTFESAGESGAQFCTGTNVTTPNFELSNISLSHNLVAPVGAGTGSGTLGDTSIDIVDADNGSETINNQSITEVGVFTITATPPAYLGETISASTSANIGRFVPDRFNVIMQNTPAFGDACTGFTYQDQPFYYNDNPSSEAPVLQVTALNSNGLTTSNYGGDFWMLTGGTLNRDYTDDSVSSAATLSPTTTQSGGFTLGGDTDFNGIGTFTLNAGTGGDAFMYQKAIPIDTPEDPFDADVDVTFAATGFQDADHNQAPHNYQICFDSNNDNNCESFTHTMIQGTELRWGRLQVPNAHGSELLALQVPITAEYFSSGAVFVTNTLDNCTTYQASDATLSEVSATDNLVPGDTMVSAPASSTTLANGVSVAGSHLTVDAPGAGRTGSLDLTLDLSTATGSDQEWLQFDANNPVGRITFGIFEGPDEFIYQREPWN
ncbi:MAG: LamG domain-containing protein [Thiotrichales bacterium]|nr:LamG domain-containing protein [Thiotrichales bacterium]